MPQFRRRRKSDIALYRPFCKRSFAYFDQILTNEEVYQYSRSLSRTS